LASRRAFGDTRDGPDAAAAGATAGCGAAATDRSIVRPVCVGVTVAGGCSPGFRIQAIVWPTGTTSPTLAMTPPSTPSAIASTSTTALSVSTSSSISPLATFSPSCFFQATSLPVS